MIKAVLFDFYGVINIGGELNQKVADFIESNNGKYKFVILSAAFNDLRPWLTKKGINKYFELVQTTGEAGFSKSDVEFYGLALERLKLDPGEVVFIDDVESYVEAARQIGIRASLYNEDMDLYSLVV